MITAVGLLQFGIISLGIMSLKILVHAHGGHVPVLATELDAHGLWLYLVPLIWALLSIALLQVSRRPFVYGIARVTGVLLALGVIVLYFVAANEIYNLHS